MRTRSGKVYHPDKSSVDMNPNAFSSGITSSTNYYIPEILKTIEKIKAQINILDQRMDRIKVEYRDRGRNEERQLNQRREDKINRNTNDTRMMSST